MNKKSNQKWFYLFLIIVTFAVLYVVSNDDYDFHQQRRFVEVGVIDLRTWEDQVIDLSGDWKFYHQYLKEDINEDTSYKVVSVPNNWSQMDESTDNLVKTYGTYQVILKGLDKNIMYGFMIPEIPTAYNFYVNDILVSSSGTVGDVKTHVGYKLPKIGAATADENGVMKLEVEVSNFDHFEGGLRESIKFGLFSRIENLQTNSLIYSMFIFSALFILGFFFIGLYLKNMEFPLVLGFGLTCLAAALRISLTGNHIFNYLFPNQSFNVLIHLKYLSGYLLLPMLLLFSVELLQFKHKKQITTAIKWFLFTSFILMVVLPIEKFVYTYLIINSINFMITVALVYVYFKKIKDGNRYAKYLIVGIVGVVFATLNNGLAIVDYNLTPLAAFIIAILFSLVIMDQVMGFVHERNELDFKIKQDPLTRLYNRLYLTTAINDTIQSYKRKEIIQLPILMFIDLDGFKKINDTLGHQFGDKALIEVGKRLTSLLPENYTVSRVGGDEFVILVKEQTIDEVVIYANEIIASLKKKMVFDGLEGKIGSSVGISVYGDDKSATSWIERSDEAMYKAKQSGGNQFMII